MVAMSASAAARRRLCYRQAQTSAIVPNRQAFTRYSSGAGGLRNARARTFERQGGIVPKERLRLGELAFGAVNLGAGATDCRVGFLRNAERLVKGKRRPYGGD